VAYNLRCGCIRIGRDCCLIHARAVSTPYHSYSYAKLEEIPARNFSPRPADKSAGEYVRARFREQVRERRADGGCFTWRCSY